MGKRTVSALSLVLLGGCVPEIRVSPREMSFDAGDAGLDAESPRDQVAPDVFQDVGLNVDRDSGTLDVLLPDVMSADVIGMDDVVDGGEILVDVPASDRPIDIPSDLGCGSCASPVHASAACVAGACAITRCTDGYRDCNGLYADGCEVAVNTRVHCGRCGGACGASEICVGGSCVVQPSCPSATERGCGVVAVPSGAFQMGSAEASTAGVLDGVVRVSSFMADAYEVTVSRFRRFWLAGHPAFLTPVRYPNGSVLPSGTVREPQYASPGYRCNWSLSVNVAEEHPVNCVDWHTAQAFCVWDHGRLPTEAEFEMMSRHRPVVGTVPPRRFPWGDETPVEFTSIYPRTVPCELAQFQFCGGEDGAWTRRVGRFAGNGGLFDLAGNVSEWLADSPETYGIGSCWSPVPVDLTDPLCASPSSVRSARGGGFGAGASGSMLGASRDARAVDATNDPELGFRCVRSP